MYDIIKLTISSGDFKASELCHRIKKLYAMGDLDEPQLEELLSLLVEHANATQERPDWLTVAQALAERIANLEAQLSVASSQSITELDGYPDWKSWDGLSDQYQKGAIVRHQNQLWISAFSGQNVWEPGTVDARFWAKYEEK